MVRTQLEPKIYRTSELADLLNVSRQTVERYIERFNLETTTIMYLNKPVRGIVLDEEKIQQILTFKGSNDHFAEEVSEEGVHDVQHGEQLMRSMFELHAQEIRTLRQEYEQEIRTLRTHYEQTVQQLQDQLNQVQIQNARLEAELKSLAGLNQIIETQKMALESSKAAIEALNNERTVITQQIQKYRQREDDRADASGGVRPWWRFWS